MRNFEPNNSGASATYLYSLTLTTDWINLGNCNETKEMKNTTDNTNENVQRENYNSEHTIMYN